MIRISGLEHVSWATSDPARAKSTLSLFGIEPTGAEEIGSQQVASTYFESTCGVRFEVIEPVGANSHLHRFLNRRGPGLHHVCFQVENLDQACAEIINAGGRLVGEAFADSRGRHAFVHPDFTGGVLIGLIELHPHLKKETSNSSR